MTEESLSDRKIVLGITGSIAAYKACELLRDLKKAGAQVRTVLTRNARRFVGETALECLSGNKVHTDMFDSPCQSLPDHVFLSEWAEVILVAPATANIIGKAAAGIADDLLSSIILAGMPKVAFAPAMHSAMFHSPVVRHNIDKLRGMGCQFIGPQYGPLASGEAGEGRLAEIGLILEKVHALLAQSGERRHSLDQEAEL